MSTTIASGPATLGVQSLDAGEGSRWFNAELEVVLGPRAPGKGVVFNGSNFAQVIDIRGFDQVLSVTFGGDLLGLGEITTGSGSFSMGGGFKNRSSGCSARGNDVATLSDGQML